MSERNLGTINMSPLRLIRKYDASNATHNSKNIHTMRIYHNVIFNVRIYNLAQIELQLGAINTAEIAATTGLEILRLQ